MAARQTLLLASVFILSACGGGGKATLVKNCVSEGENRETCECMADAAEADLSPKLFDLLVEVSDEGDDAAQSMLSDLSLAEQGEVMAFGLKAAMSCGAG